MMQYVLARKHCKMKIQRSLLVVYVMMPVVDHGSDADRLGKWVGFGPDTTDLGPVCKSRSFQEFDDLI